MQTTKRVQSTLIREALEELVWQYWVRRGEQEEAVAFARQPRDQAEIEAGENIEAWGAAMPRTDRRRL